MGAAFTNGDFLLFDERDKVIVDFAGSNRGLIMGDMLDAGRDLFKMAEESNKYQRAKANFITTADPDRLTEATEKN